MESNTNLRRKDTTKGPPLRILSLDGGGVRGYSMLILLQELMYKTFNEAEGRAPKRDEIPKPCDYFDLIAGTGTGGLIAIMLGRLRLDLETCKEVYTRMTRMVFETDKTIAGIPYRSTLFKASKLEEAIQKCVQEHTIFENEGNDGTAQGGKEFSLSDNDKRRSIASTVGSSSFNPSSPQHMYAAMRWGNPNASLYDSREERTKTAVTAAYKGTRKNENVILLRSYDSRKEPPPEFNCKIWQAGRATSATGLAFKPIQIGQSVFIDEGAMNFNPSPHILDEAVVNEWPGRELGVFVSIGTGKRPAGTGAQQSEWWEGFIGGNMGSFAEARRRLISKIEGCEKTHEYMLSEHLMKRGVNVENYYRLNVEVGVGEFGMNEWHRLADINTNTRRYLAKSQIRKMNEEAAAKLAKIERAKRRFEHGMRGQCPQHQGNQQLPLPTENPMAVELPGDEGRSYQGMSSPAYSQASTPGDKFTVLSPMDAPTSDVSRDDKFSVLSPTDIPQSAVDQRYRRSGEYQNPYDSRLSDSSIIPTPPRRSHESQMSGMTGEAPPLPPKTPLQPTGIPGYGPPPTPPRSHPIPGPPHHAPLPYPDDDGPPPTVNMASKPEFMGR